GRHDPRRRRSAQPLRSDARAARMNIHASQSLRAAGTGTVMPDALITIRDGGKTYHSERGDIAALRNIDLDVAAGEFVSILGPSGCGKSTLLKCIGGLQPLTGGSVAIGGRPVLEPPEDTGFVFQRDVLLDWRTVVDNVLLPAEFQKL